MREYTDPSNDAYECVVIEVSKAGGVRFEFYNTKSRKAYPYVLRIDVSEFTEEQLKKLTPGAVFYLYVTYDAKDTAIRFYEGIVMTEERLTEIREKAKQVMELFEPSTEIRSGSPLSGEIISRQYFNGYGNECVCGFNPPIEPNLDCERCRLLCDLDEAREAAHKYFGWAKLSKEEREDALKKYPWLTQENEVKK